MFIHCVWNVAKWSTRNNNVHQKHFNLNLKHKSKCNIFNVCLSSLSLFNPSLNTITNRHIHQHHNSNNNIIIIINTPINDLVVPNEGFIPYTKQIYTNTYLSTRFLSIFTQPKYVINTFISYQVNKHLHKHLPPFFHNHIKQHRTSNHI